jgi:peptidoglycan/LPS O-acetylase OafA/YrhL
VTVRHHRLPGLDGLRALAVLMVVFHHLCSQGALGRWPGLQVMLQQGSFGVQIFFVLSGFLITWLLLKEESRSGTIDIARFYFRRSLRILPPAFFYLAVILILTVAGVLAVGTRDLVYSALFIRNAYGVGGSPEVSHYWSLAVEEQFYLTWPFLLLVLRGRTRLLVTAALIVLLAVWRSWTSLHFGVTAAGAHALLFGCLLAQLRQTRSTSPYVLQGVLQSPVTFVASAAVILAVIFFRVPDGATAGWLQVWPILATTLIVNYSVAGHQDLISRFLNLGPVEWVGRLSYSLYLWQELFCWSPVSNQYAASAWPLLVALSFACASISYYFVERPALSAREKLEHRWYPASLPRLSSRLESLSS